MNEEQKLVEQYLEAGVDLPELKQEQPKEEEAPAEPKAGEKPEEPKEPLQETPRQERKRSIYDEYKEKKTELKSERELREKAERERDEYRTKLEALSQAETQEEHQEAKDDLEAFAQAKGLDAQALREMRDLFTKDLKPTIDPTISQKLQKFEQWEAETAREREQQMFEREFADTLPTLKNLLPNANDDELSNVKKELDRLSHTERYHDKELAYVAWAEKDALSKLVSPKKRGMESKGKADTESSTFEFDPNADYASMTPKEREKWEAEYRKATSQEGLVTDSQGRKIII